MKFSKVLNELRNDIKKLISAEVVIKNYDASAIKSKPEDTTYTIGNRELNFGQLRSETKVLWKVMASITNKVWKTIPKNEEPADIVLNSDGTVTVTPELGNSKGKSIDFTLEQLGFKDSLETIMTEISNIKSLMN